MLYTLNNDQVSVSIESLGAELQSVIRHEDQLEYIWRGDAAYWSKKSPVLFPIVGGLRNNSYSYQGNSYTLSRHGFAREKEFTPTDRTGNSITFTLTDTADTRKVYPFPFRFSVIYTLNTETLTVRYVVENTGKDPMYFSVGAHPAFAVPLVAGTSYTDHYLLFNEKETTGKWPLSADGLIMQNPVPFFDGYDQVSLTRDLFYGDALMFKHLRSSAISIRNTKNEHGLTLSYADFPYMGIWAAKNADFVCIEPWCGIADHVDVSGELSGKEGINKLLPEEAFQRNWSITVF